MDNILKELAKNAIINEVEGNLERYFDYECYQTDVDDFHFRFDGLNSCEAEFEFECGEGMADLKAEWYDAELNDDLGFTLYRVEVTVTEYSEDSSTTTSKFFYSKI